MGWLVLMSTAALAFSMALSATEPSQNTIEATPSSHVVYIEGMQFSPSSLQVNIGDTITWINNDIVPHTATAVDKSWDSKNLSKGDEFSLTVDENTLLQYFCVYHPNMVAQIELISGK